ncbi:type I secretion outer membrane protein, TolC family [Budvicia aquatica]|uniref:Type I secretion outer membrane protein, TolC family n=1 Tax=Budvicia aquatica TaxID=82979 RepID=A0A484ZN69_9GAMM|nr:type I secretion outer membrane protein, TolC family [Budvicia aquatica]
MFYPPVVFFVIGLFIISVDNLPISHAAPLPKWAEAPTVQQSKTLSLRDAILRAFGRSPAIAQASAQAGIGQAQIDEAQSVWYPQVSLSGTSGHSKQADSSGSLNNSASYGLTLSQLVYDFGKTNNNIKKQETVSASYYYNLLSVMNEVGEKTALTYLDVKRYQSLCDAVEDNIKSLEAVRDMAQLRADAGIKFKF